VRVQDGAGERAVMVREALADRDVVARFWALTRATDTACGVCWVGAITGRGHGRFWLGRGADGKSVAIVAHRFAAGLVHGYAAISDSAVQCTHACDEASCVRVGEGHIGIGTAASNTEEWRQRRVGLGSALRDTRGARGRSLAARDAALSGQSVASALHAGLPEIDRYQVPLPGLG
jgi:hypothetical protein